ncbi:linear amide C-N hydrolase [Burkholderia sp. 9120]|uniref:linear amide C-N hydrolase n=1 Tax=Burkholderia sp. 9120 TaxID=1500897 RepID=UPI0005550746|nr:linear amide C-N hydrolase [Burkholderia sp. 9120]
MCTDFLLKAADGSVVNGRSMEFGAELNSRFLVVGRGTPMHSTTPDLSHGLRWTCKHGMVAINAFNLPIATDGVNEAGLSVGVLWLPGITQYASTASDPSRALFVGQLANWLLASFATVGEVREGLSGVDIWGGGKAVEQRLPVHFAVHDRHGHSIVIEFTDKSGKPTVYDNPAAVLTNAPAFPWHLSNIDNFVGLHARDAEPLEAGHTAFSPCGHGSGMRGLPGDSTPPSRFIRAFYLKRFATQPADAASARNLALHLLNTVDIPLGTSRSLPENGKTEDDYTQWAVVKTLTAPSLGIRTYGNTTLMEIDLKQIDLETPGERTYPVPTEPVAINISATLRPQ